MDWSTIKGVTIPEGKVTKITDAQGNEVWRAGFGFVGVTISESTSTPTSRVSYPATLSTGQKTYTNAAYGATPMSGAGSSFTVGSWGTGSLAMFLKGIKPVSFNGSTWTDLNKTSESSWPTSQGTDCFTEFPFRWLSITKSGSTVTIVFSDASTQPDSTFQNYAFLGADGTTQRKNFHLGCYTASGSTSAIYSRGGSTSNLVSTAMNKYYVAAAARGSEYDCMSFHQWTYLQAMFVLLYKSTNSQGSHSYGYVGGSAVQSNSAFASYGNDYGMHGSTANTTTQNAFFWLHNLWGNMYQFIASAFTRAGSSYEIYYILSAMSKSSNWDNSSWNSTSSYALMSSKGTDSGTAIGSSGYYMVNSAGTNKAGFIRSGTSSGSDSTYYCDYTYGYRNSSYASFMYVGGYYGSSTQAGIFYYYQRRYSYYSGSYYGARLSYRGGHSR